MNKIEVGTRVAITGGDFGYKSYHCGYQASMDRIIDAEVAYVTDVCSDGTYQINIEPTRYTGYWFVPAEFKVLDEKVAEDEQDGEVKEKKTSKLYALVGEEGIVGVYLTRKLARRYKAMQGGKAEGYKIEQYTRKKEVR